MRNTSFKTYKQKTTQTQSNTRSQLHQTTTIAHTHRKHNNTEIHIEHNINATRHTTITQNNQRQQSQEYTTTDFLNHTSKTTPNNAKQHGKNTVQHRTNKGNTITPQTKRNKSIKRQQQ